MRVSVSEFGQVETLDTKTLRLVSKLQTHDDLFLGFDSDADHRIWLKLLKELFPPGPGEAQLILTP